MFKKWWNSFCYSFGLSTLLTLLVSLSVPHINIKALYASLCIILPYHVFAFFTFELRLFSKHLWVRRAITICFSVIDIITVLWVFNYARLKEKLWVYLAIILPVIVLFTVFVYYVSDKIEKRNLAAINQKLASGNMDANKQ
jgi:hypothetical protein